VAGVSMRPSVCRSISRIALRRRSWNRRPGSFAPSRAVAQALRKSPIGSPWRWTHGSRASPYRRRRGPRARSVGARSAPLARRPGAAGGGRHSCRRQPGASLSRRLGPRRYRGRAPTRMDVGAASSARPAAGVQIRWAGPSAQFYGRLRAAGGRPRRLPGEGEVDLPPPSVEQRGRSWVPSWPPAAGAWTTRKGWHSGPTAIST
jgi:hypothetical protein